MNKEQFSEKLDKLITKYALSDTKDIEMAIKDVLSVILKTFIDIYTDSVLLSEQDRESKIYHVNSLFNVCKKTVIESITNGGGK